MWQTSVALLLTQLWICTVLPQEPLSPPNLQLQLSRFLKFPLNKNILQRENKVEKPSRGLAACSDHYIAARLDLNICLETIFLCHCNRAPQRTVCLASQQCLCCSMWFCLQVLIEKCEIIVQKPASLCSLFRKGYCKCLPQCKIVCIFKVMNESISTPQTVTVWGCCPLF